MHLSAPSHPIGKHRALAARFIEDQCELNGFSLLAISFRHLVAVESLPWHHRDPFDHLLVAQAMEDGFTLVTRDATLARYGIKTIG
jgi:PIN domain nuclease of toxin-antitoxin system